jgi:DNA polymerase III epsilon subunit-like protein
VAALGDALDDAVVVGYNIGFDLRLLRLERQRHGLPPVGIARRDTWCVMETAMLLIDGMWAYTDEPAEPRLLSLGEALGEQLQPRGQGARILLPGHRARSDARAALARLDAIALWGEPAAALAPTGEPEAVAAVAAW